MANYACMHTHLFTLIGTKRSICCRQVGTSDLLEPRLRPKAKIFMLEIYLFILAQLLPPNGNGVSLEIQFKIILVNSCYYGLNRQLSGGHLSSTTKIIIYMTLSLTCSAEAWRVLSIGAIALRVFQRRFSVQCELAMIFASNPTISSSTQWTLCGILTSSD